MKGQQTLGTLQGFAIDGNNLSLDQAVYRLHPTEKTLLKCQRFNGGDQTSKGIISRDPSFKQAVAEKPIMVAQDVLTNVRPATGSSNNGTHSAKQNIKQRIVDLREGANKSSHRSGL